jgi:two-component system, OmpR family, response regulator
MFLDAGIFVCILSEALPVTPWDWTRSASGGSIARQAPGGSQVAMQVRETTLTRPAALVVEDDAEIGELIVRFLKSQEMDADVVANGQAMDRAIASRDYDVLILDLNLPGEDGLAICRRLRADCATPIIMVTARGDDVDKIIGLEMGADDYLSKPFNPRELLARIRAVLRRSSAEGSRGDRPRRGLRYEFAGWRVELSTRELTSPSQTKTALTGAEFDLLHALCEHSNRILTRDQILGLLHGPLDGPNERSIDTLISRLRQKLELEPRSPQMIQTIRSEGYMFTPKVTVR